MGAWGADGGPFGRLLREHGVEHEVFDHRPVRDYADADAARREAGFAGTDGKSLVFRDRLGFAVFTTLVGRRADVPGLRAALGGGRLRLATAEELRREVGAEPGCAYPCGFAPEIRVVVDPAVYAEPWLLFSPGDPTRTVRLRGEDFRRLVAGLPNPVHEAPAAGDGRDDAP